MIYARLNDRATLAPYTQVTVRDVAQVHPADENILSQPINCPMAEGVWKLESLELAKAITKQIPDAQIALLGPAVCYVHRTAHLERGRLHTLRLIIAFLLLTIGSALALSWFHSDVNMAAAQRELFALFTGHPPQEPLLIYIPYGLGVGLGVAMFYSLIGHRSISPMDIKLQQYRKDAESTEGRDVPHG